MSTVLVALVATALAWLYPFVYSLGRRRGWDAYRRMRWQEARDAGLPVPADWDR